MGALAAKRRVSLKEMAGHVLRAESPEADREEGDDTGAPVSRKPVLAVCHLWLHEQR